MNWLWIAAAFVAGMAFTWYVAGRLAYKAFSRSLIVEGALGRMTYAALLNVRESLDRELAKRRAPVEAES